LQAKNGEKVRKTPGKIAETRDYSLRKVSNIDSFGGNEKRALQRGK
jgi:hypothetical protein